MKLLRTMGASLTHRSRRRELARRFDSKPQIVAQMLMLFRAILADGIVRDQEMRIFSDICARQFGVLSNEMTALHSYLERWQRRDDADTHLATLRSLPIDQRQRLIHLMQEITAVSVEGDADQGALGRQTQLFIADARTALGLTSDDWQPAPMQNHLKS